MTRYPTTPMCDGELLARFEATVRPSDVIVSTPAKSGQTWLQTLLYHLKTHGRSPDFGGQTLFDVSPWLELPGDSPIRKPPVERATLLSSYAALPDPRVFKMHVVWDEIPRPAGSGAKVITITRDPRDVAFSMFSHIDGMKQDVTQTSAVSFDEFFEGWMQRGLYFKFVQSFWPHVRDPDVLWLRYEDLHADVRGHAERLVAFLGWDLPPDTIDRCLPLVAFDHMQRRERSDERLTDRWKDGRQFFREGAIGKNRQRLTRDQERRIVERVHADLGDECAAFVLSLPADALALPLRD